MKFPNEILQQCWFIAGPTAVGKSALGIELANLIGGEIVSLDSMAIYRKMDIGTAKPAADQLRRVPHHLIDLVQPHEDYSTAEYLRAAIAVCSAILQRGKTPIFVGGTGLYLRSVLRGVFEGPPADWDFRRELEMRTEHEGVSWLHGQLTRVDPECARKLHPNDVRRIVRALEIHHLTGQPAVALQSESLLPAELRPRHVYWLEPNREWLYDRINQRVKWMIQAGLQQEVHELLSLDPPIGRTARQALGYREMIHYLEQRISSLDLTINLIQTHTRQFAKRQHTWFRNLEECISIRIEPNQQSPFLDEFLAGIESAP